MKYKKVLECMKTINDKFKKLSQIYVDTLITRR